MSLVRAVLGRGLCGVVYLMAGLLLAVLPVHAHEIRPAYLQIDEISPGRYQVLWRTPVLSGMQLPVVLKLPKGVQTISGPTEQHLPDSLVERLLVSGRNGASLAGTRFEFVGLQATITDVLVRVQMLNGDHSTTLVEPAKAWVEIGQSQGAISYVRLGVEHILLGIDHLLFVLGLVLLVKNRWMLLKTITAFTCAHSITLAVATLGYATVPVPPINATIALSILFLGPEIVRSWRGGTSRTIRHPWMVAFAFGLLHGFGFANGLVQMGLPQSDIPLSLLCFNIGVELGQLGFVALVLFLERSFRILEVRWPRWVEAMPAYAVGSLGAFWTIDRLAAMFAGGA
jgi:hydrogenase/urease accessory protein HupE